MSAETRDNGADRGGPRDIHALLREYIDAGIAVGREEAAADPRCIDTDPELDRAFERCAALRMEVGTVVVGLLEACRAAAAFFGPNPAAALHEPRTETERWAVGRLTETAATVRAAIAAASDSPVMHQEEQS
jgi:hypothetical protein